MEQSAELTTLNTRHIPLRTGCMGVMFSAARGLDRHPRIWDHHSDHWILFVPTYSTHATLTEWSEEARLQSKFVSPEPRARVSALRPQSAIRVLPNGPVVRQVRFVLRFGVVCLVPGARTAKVRQPERAKEGDSDGDKGESQQKRCGHEEAVVATHRRNGVDAAAVHSLRWRRLTGSVNRSFVVGGGDRRGSLVTSAAVASDTLRQPPALQLQCSAARERLT